MDRFEYAESKFEKNETFIAKEDHVKLYDGDIKTSFEHGELVLTSHRLLWAKPGEISKGLTCLSLALRYIVFIEDEIPSTFSFSRSHKIILHLSAPTSVCKPGPVAKSFYDSIKLSFKEGLTTNFSKLLNSAIAEKKWEVVVETSPTKTQPVIKTRTGIVGIERSLKEKQKATDDSISAAFQDLDQLMVMAKDMVHLSNIISTKIREKQGDITEDETVRFKSYLMSLGIDDPVTRDGHKNEDQYFKNLAQQIELMLVEPLSEAGGMMLLSDVYCRVNRARGLELLSPEDLLEACRLLEPLGLSVRLRQFESGVMVLQLASHDDSRIVEDTAKSLEVSNLSAEELSQSLGVSVMLAKERLLTTEKYGRACRDDSIEGLRFYPNKFLTEEDD